MMSLNVLELPPSVYSALLKAAQDTGTTPVGWIAAHLPGSLQENGTDDAPLARIQRLAYYLGTVSNAGDISHEAATTALIVWNEISKTLRALPVPDAAPGPEGQLLYTWNRGEHHLELEIFPEAPAEFFYYNRASEETWQEDYRVGEPLSEAALARLSLFL